jgi:hypothetical protein
MQIKTPMMHHFTPSKMAVLKEKELGAGGLCL